VPPGAPEPPVVVPLPPAPPVAPLPPWQVRVVWLLFVVFVVFVVALDVVWFDVLFVVLFVVVVVVTFACGAWMNPAIVAFELNPAVAIEPNVLYAAVVVLAALLELIAPSR
jgi:hypothetical protein